MTGFRAGMIDECTTPHKNQKLEVGNHLSKAPIEYERAIEEFEGDEGFLMEVMEGFLGKVRTQIETIRKVNLRDSCRIRSDATSRGR